ncbi:MAG: hypothetical protein HKO66_04040 [Saprospiraceae bacterium]|nr:hypothetical protein [Saprospiraceae bacterium]NNL91381.1 hypothetical protein [Saprospiraceae bacterium]
MTINRVIFLSVVLFGIIASFNIYLIYLNDINVSTTEKTPLVSFSFMKKGEKAKPHSLNTCENAKAKSEQQEKALIQIDQFKDKSKIDNTLDAISSDQIKSESQTVLSEKNVHESGETERQNFKNEFDTYVDSNQYTILDSTKFIDKSKSSHNLLRYTILAKIVDYKLRKRGDLTNYNFSNKETLSKKINDLETPQEDFLDLEINRSPDIKILELEYNGLKAFDSENITLNKSDFNPQTFNTDIHIKYIDPKNELQETVLSVSLGQKSLFLKSNSSIPNKLIGTWIANGNEKVINTRKKGEFKIMDIFEINDPNEAFVKIEIAQNNKAVFHQPGNQKSFSYDYAQKENILTLYNDNGIFHKFQFNSISDTNINLDHSWRIKFTHEGKSITNKFAVLRYRLNKVINNQVHKSI